MLISGIDNSQYDIMVAHHVEYLNTNLPSSFNVACLSAYHSPQSWPL